MEDTANIDPAMNSDGDFIETTSIGELEVMNGTPTITIQSGSSSDSAAHTEMSPLKRGFGHVGLVAERPVSGWAKEGSGLKVIIGSSIAFAVVITVALIVQIYFGPPQIELHGGVAADSAICSSVGTDILKKKGSAVDAAIASMLCLGVINAQSTGIGGGGFMLVHDHKSMTSNIIDFRETAPSKASKDMLKGNSPGAFVGIPGEIRGMEYAHSQYGTLSWKELFQPAINIARTGFKVNKEIYTVLQRHAKLSLMKTSPMLSKMYLKKDKLTGELTWKKEGDTIVRPEFANTLETIANSGANAFYEGSIAENMVNEINNHSGRFTLQDFKDYKVELRKPLKGTFKKYSIHTMPVPSSGSILLSLLNIMEGYNLTSNTPLYYHRLAEAIKFAYAQQPQLGDPKFNKNMKNIQEKIANKSLADSMRVRINDTQSYSDASHYGTPSIPNPGTTHLSVIGPNEYMVAVTSSVNYWFGSYIVTKDGILLNNGMADFETDAGKARDKANLVEPGKRARSSMIPTLLFDTNKPCGKRMVVGASNGSRIISGVAEVLLNSILFDKNIEDAIELPRLHSTLYPSVVLELEKGFPKEVEDYLVKVGHNIEHATEGVNIVQAVQEVHEDITAHSDSRKFSNASTF